MPTLYFAEGLPYVIINSVSVILYKRMGIDNAQIAFWTSLLYLPWVIKMLWAPFVDLVATKRLWVLYTQLAMAVLLLIAAFSLETEVFFPFSLLMFCVAAFTSATHDVAADGFYMLALTKQDQALFAGIRTTFYRLAMIFGTGGLVYFAGLLERYTGSISKSWATTIGAAAAIFVIFYYYHRMILPSPLEDIPGGGRGGHSEGSFMEIVRSYFGQKRIIAVIFFILFYRFAEAMLLKLVSPFLLDPPSQGGMGLSTEQVGLVYGTIGTASLIAGGIAGGLLISRFGLRRCIWPLAFVLHLPNLVYVYMSHAQPPIEVVTLLIAMEQLGYGLGFTAFTVFLMYTAAGRFKTSHFAISTGIMALGMMLPGMVSGYIQEAVGYKTFFLIVVGMSIPGLLSVAFIPKDDK